MGSVLKAKYLYELRTQEHLPFAEIVDYCGGRQTEVVEHINAFSDMETYYRPIVQEDGDFRHHAGSAVSSSFKSLE